MPERRLVESISRRVKSWDFTTWFRIGSGGKEYRTCFVASEGHGSVGRWSLQTREKGGIEIRVCMICGVNILDNFKPRLESGMLKWISWLNVPFFKDWWSGFFFVRGSQRSIEWPQWRLPFHQLFFFPGFLSSIVWDVEQIFLLSSTSFSLNAYEILIFLIHLFWLNPTLKAGPESVRVVRGAARRRAPQRTAYGRTSGSRRRRTAPSSWGPAAAVVTGWRWAALVVYLAAVKSRPPGRRTLTRPCATTAETTATVGHVVRVLRMLRREKVVSGTVWLGSTRWDSISVILWVDWYSSYSRKLLISS